MTSRRWGILFTVVALFCGLAGPAYAEEWVGRDKGGDVARYTFDLEPEPCGTETVTPLATKRGDLKRVTINHTAQAIRISLKMRAVPRRGPLSIGIGLQTSKKQYDVSYWRAAKGKPYLDLSRMPRFDPPDASECGYYVLAADIVTCKGLAAKLDARRDRVEFTVPKSCLPKSRWVRPSVYIRTETKSGDASDYWQDQQGGHLGPKIYARR